MKKFFLILLSFLFLLNVQAFAFKGDPLVEHAEYPALIKDYFARGRTITGDPNIPYPMCWEKKYEGLFSTISSDYRTIKVYNIPYLVSYNPRNDPNGAGFFVEYARALLEARQKQTRTEALARTSREVAARYFSDEIKEYARQSGFSADLQNFLGADTEDHAMDAFIASLLLSASSRVLGAIVGTSCIVMNVFNFLAPLAFEPHIALTITIVHNLLNIVRIFTTGSTFAAERVANYALLLTRINLLLADDSNLNQMKNSNVLVTAVDERNFYSLFLWNSYPGRRNDGAWANFVRIGDLDCSPLARNYDGSWLTAYKDAFREIMRNDHLDFDMLRARIDSLRFGVPATR